MNRSKNVSSYLTLLIFLTSDYAPPAHLIKSSKQIMMQTLKRPFFSNYKVMLGSFEEAITSTVMICNQDLHATYKAYPSRNDIELPEKNSPSYLLPIVTRVGDRS